ncbi:MAG: transcription-repair coupling factor [Chlamydiales bacterium]
MTIIKNLLESLKLRELHEAVSKGHSILVEGVWQSPKALLSAIAQQATGKHVVILTGDTQEEASLFHDFSVFTDRPVVDFPAWETLPNENIPPSPDIVGQRYQVLEKIIASQEPHIILTGLQACLQKLIDPDQFCSLHLSLKKGERHSFQGLIDQLVRMGYTRTPLASDKGEFAVRGGIIDIFPVSLPDPYRIEFWGDDVESIRIYDPIGQKTVRAVEGFSITAARELEFLSENPHLYTLFDYLGEDVIVVFDDLLALEDRYASLMGMLGEETPQFATLHQLLDLLEPYQKLYFTKQSIEDLSTIQSLPQERNNTSMPHISFEFFNRKIEAYRWHHPFQTLEGFLGYEEGSTPEEILHEVSLRKEVPTLFLCSTELEEEALQKKILDAHIVLDESTRFQIGYLTQGFVVYDCPLMVFPYTELSHRYRMRRQKLRSTYHTSPAQVYELTPGDHVVHFHHGVGKYLGIDKRPDHNQVLKEFFIVEYANQSKLFVPVNQAHLLTKYVGASEEVPALHTIGSTRWQRTRDKTQQAIMAYASDLLELYAKREIHGGFAFKEDTPDMQSFEEDFPFEETEDQLEAIRQMKNDMCASKPMDRLVCGDVGYGKTEVAMRAAFKAVLDGGKQVAVLVPTTVLALQHYENFSERMANFPVTIGVLSRFQKAQEVRQTIEGVKNGTIDILVGTHRIISDDVVFNDLGLIVIDEEQRFGVKAKEHLKKIKMGVDCLTLSATPIPRTLYMSLIGARDMSVISTPPQDRLPIKSVIAEPTDQTIKNALLRELARDGQAYFIHNRVETIYDAASRIKKLVPQARVAVAHGQMHAKEIDAVFHAFKKGEIDVLVATTIVENGIDIPNANTILIHQADHFGLADLYQLRGRVGRWNRRAYCCFLVPKLHLLPEISRQRLNALVETSGYGGGMKVAMRDLEIRGAGDILGYEQSGHVASIGFHLYCKMLKRTIKTLQGKLSAGLVDTKIESYHDARLPDGYVEEVSIRMEFYQRFGEAASLEELESLWEELIDRFGAPPEQALWLYHLARIRVFASQHGLTLVKIDKVSITIEKGQQKNPVIRKMLTKVSLEPDECEKQVIERLQKFNEEIAAA